VSQHDRQVTAVRCFSGFGKCAGIAPLHGCAITSVKITVRKGSD